MRYIEWLEKITALHKKAQLLLVDEELLSEEATVHVPERGRHPERDGVIKVSLGDALKFRWNSQLVMAYDVKQLYSAKEKGWASILGGLTAKISMSGVLNEKLLTVAVRPYMSEAVLDRLTGENDMLDNTEIIRTAAEKRLQALSDSLPYWLGHAEFRLPSPDENYELHVEYWRGNSRQVTYGSPGLKRHWSFLQNYGEIENTVKQFVTRWRSVVVLCYSK